MIRDRLASRVTRQLTLRLSPSIVQGRRCPTPLSPVISASSPTSTTARRRSPTACSNAPAPSEARDSRTSSSTRWTWNASGASRSRRIRWRCTTRRRPGRNTVSTCSIPRGTSISPTKFRRSLAACEGALLIVDAAQGVEAQTVANVHLAMKQGLTIIPVINKIDLPNADLPSVRRQLEEILAIPAEEAILASAKAGIGIDDILEAVVARIPSPPTHGRTGRPDGARAGVRFDVRHLPGRRQLRADFQRARRAGQPDPAAEHGQDLRREGSRACSRRRCSAPARWKTATWATSSPTSRARRRSRSATR